MEAAQAEPANADAGRLTAEAEKRLDAWLSLPEGDRAELLGGRIVYKAMASIEHGDAVMGIAEQLGRFRGPPGTPGGWWLSQEVDMYLAGQGLRPDMVGWRMDKHPRPPRKVNITSKHLGVYVTSPDWVCEVLSSSTKARDEEEGLKWQAYYDAGVGHYWLVDLFRQQLTVYQRGVRDYEPVEILGREGVKALPPFETTDLVAKRVFLLADLLKQEGGS
jgi:Uma2 family endonuclease